MARHHELVRLSVAKPSSRERRYREGAAGTTPASLRASTTDMRTSLSGLRRTVDVRTRTAGDPLFRQTTGSPAATAVHDHEAAASPVVPGPTKNPQDYPGGSLRLRSVARGRYWSFLTRERPRNLRAGSRSRRSSPSAGDSGQPRPRYRRCMRTRSPPALGFMANAIGLQCYVLSTARFPEEAWTGAFPRDVIVLTLLWPPAAKF
jgi:hypothetical protein